jgi:hypothetical protein
MVFPGGCRKIESIILAILLSAYAAGNINHPDIFSLESNFPKAVVVVVVVIAEGVLLVVVSVPPPAGNGIRFHPQNDKAVRGDCL